MFNALLDIITPERTLERDQEVFRLGLARLLKPLPSDGDPINHQLSNSEPAGL